MRLLDALSRMAAGPLMVRAAAFGSGFAALLLAVPQPAWNQWYALAGVALAGIAAYGVGTGWVAVLEGVAAGVWFLFTTWYAYPASPPVVLGLAAALYVHHSACALAAVLPMDATVSPEVLVGWLRRTGGVLGVTLPVGLIVLGLPSLLGRSSAVWLPLAGLAALLTAAYALLRLARDPG